VLVGDSEVVGVEAVDAGIVSLDGVAGLAKCRAKRVSKLNMQKNSSGIRGPLFATYILGCSSSYPPATHNCLPKGLGSMLSDPVP
jgi:hypothetical protein